MVLVKYSPNREFAFDADVTCLYIYYILENIQPCLNLRLSRKICKWAKFKQSEFFSLTLLKKAKLRANLYSVYSSQEPLPYRDRGQ